MGRTPYGGGGYPPSQGFSFFGIGLDRKILNTPGISKKSSEHEESRAMGMPWYEDAHGEDQFIQALLPAFVS